MLTRIKLLDPKQETSVTHVHDRCLKISVELCYIKSVLSNRGFLNYRCGRLLLCTIHPDPNNSLIISSGAGVGVKGIGKTDTNIYFLILKPSGVLYKSGILFHRNNVEHLILRIIYGINNMKHLFQVLLS